MLDAIFYILRTGAPWREDWRRFATRYDKLARNYLAIGHHYALDTATRLVIPSSGVAVRVPRIAPLRQRSRSALAERRSSSPRILEVNI